MSPLPSANDIWSMVIPNIDTNEPVNLLDNMLIANLPDRYVDYLYNGVAMNTDFQHFLGDAAPSPFFRIAGVLAVLETMAGDAQFGSDRDHINRDKITLFWKIIGKEQAPDARTSSGDSWPTEDMAALQTHASRIMDDCQLYVYKNHCEQMKPFFDANVQKAESEKIFIDFRSKVSSDLNVEFLKQKLIQSGVESLVQQVYAFWVKLGLLERSTWQKNAGDSAWMVVASVSTQNRDLRLESPIPLTKACVKDICEQLAIQTVGQLDDTTRAQIRAIPERMTNIKSGFRFVPAIQTMMSSPLLNPRSVAKLVENMEEGSVPLVATLVWGSLMGEQAVQNMKGHWFISHEAKPLGVWRD